MPNTAPSAKCGSSLVPKLRERERNASLKGWGRRVMSPNPERRPAGRGGRPPLPSGLPLDLRFAGAAPLATRTGPHEKPTSLNPSRQGPGYLRPLNDVFKMNIFIHLPG